MEREKRSRGREREREREREKRMAGQKDSTGGIGSWQ